MGTLVSGFHRKHLGCPCRLSDASQRCGGLAGSAIDNQPAISHETRHDLQKIPASGAKLKPNAGGRGQSDR